MTNETSSIPRIRFIGDGTITQFNFFFRIFEASDIRIYFADEEKTSGFTVSFDKDISGGKVTFAEAPASGTFITITRDLDIKRTTLFSESQIFRTEMLNQEFDYHIACLEQLSDGLNRTISFPITMPPEVDSSLPYPEGGKTLMWNTSGTKLINSQMDIENLDATISNLMRISEIFSEQNSLILGNTGDIKWTTRRTVPEGGTWCDGSEFTKSQFSYFYEQLVNGDYNTVSYADYAQELANNGGECGFYALDTTNEKFRIPVLKSVFIRATGNSNDIGSYQGDAIRNISGTIGSVGDNRAGDTWVPTDPFYQIAVSTYSGGTTGAQSRAVGMDLSKSVPTADENRPRNICYRPYIVLYQVAVETSMLQANELINELSDKANTDLSNINVNIDYVIENWQSTNGNSWYRKYKSGWIEQGGKFTGGIVTGGTITLPIPFSDTNYIAFVIQISTNNAGTDTNANRVRNLTENSFAYYANSGTGFWEAKGY